MFRPSHGITLLALWAVAPLVQAEAPAAEEIASLEAQLAEATRLPLVERIALLRNPVLAESSERALAARERAQTADRLPAPELKYEQWGVPLRRPHALDRADTLMFGMRQAFPAPGARAARTRVLGEETRMAADQRELTGRDLVLRVRRAYFDYDAAERALGVHNEHLGVAQQLAEQVRTDYGAGRGSQQDVLKVLVELSRLHNDVAEVRQQRESSRLLLNALMARAPDAPLGPPQELARPEHVPTLAQLETARSARRPELSLAQHAIKRSEATLEAAKIAARRPTFMVGADYWLMPTRDMPHAYGVMVSMSLPWLVTAWRAEQREAEHLLAAERHAAEATERMTTFELHDALARLRAAETSQGLIERSILPEAEKSLEATRAAFSLGQGSLLSLLDAQRAYFEIRLEQSRARALVMTQLAALEFASGAPLLGGAPSAVTATQERAP